ncbi:hypothetical protein AOLI_G00088830 [Acnodon oligacanthus]
MRSSQRDLMMPSVSLSLPAALAGRARTWVCLSCMFWTRGPDAKAVWKVHAEFGTCMSTCGVMGHHCQKSKSAIIQISRN